MVTRTVLSKDTIETIDVEQLVNSHLEGRGTQLVMSIKFVVGTEYKDVVNLNVFNSEIIRHLLTHIIKHFVQDADLCISEDLDYEASICCVSRVREDDAVADQIKDFQTTLDSITNDAYELGNKVESMNAVSKELNNCVYMLDDIINEMK